MNPKIKVKSICEEIISFYGDPIWQNLNSTEINCFQWFFFVAFSPQQFFKKMFTCLNSDFF